MPGADVHLDGRQQQQRPMMPKFSSCPASKYVDRLDLLMATLEVASEEKHDRLDRFEMSPHQLN